MAVWPYVPQKDVTESLEWCTDVMRCRSAEYRQSLRSKPRQELTMRFVMTEAQFSAARMLAMTIGGGACLVPLWQWHIRPGNLASGATVIPEDIADPPRVFDVGTSVLVWESSSKWEAAVILLNSTNPAYPYLTLTAGLSTSYTDPVVIPLRSGEFAQEFEATRSSSTVIETSARFRVQVGDDYSGDYASRGGLYSAEEYQSIPVVTDRSLSASGIREQFERKWDEIDSIIGGAYRFPVFAAPEQSGQFAWVARNRSEMRALTYWLHSRKGQWKSFWVPTWNRDLTVTAEIAANTTSIEIADIGFRTNARIPCDIMILTTAGARIYCHVTAASAGDPGKELIGLSAQVGTHLFLWDIAMVCMLKRTRFAADRIEIHHGPAGTAMVSAPTVEVPT